MHFSGKVGNSALLNGPAVQAALSMALWCHSILEKLRFDVWNAEHFASILVRLGLLASLENAVPEPVSILRII